MTKIPLAIVGCGGMGGRHLLGLKELTESESCNVELVAVCDLHRGNAEHLADDAEKLLGQRPVVFGDMEAMVREIPDLQAVDITTDTVAHHIVASAAFDLGLGVLCEKPLGLTIRSCNRILAARERSGKVLSVAENYRRDPMLRLTRALIDANIIGKPTMFFDVSAGGGNRVVITTWRHEKNRGGILLDVGVHNADVMQYYLGSVRQVYANIQLLEPIRYKPSTASTVSSFYRQWYDEMPDQFDATAEDAMVSVLTFESGAVGQWTAFMAAHGQGFGQRAIYGPKGRLTPGGARNGVPPTLFLDGEPEMTGDALLDLVPDFCLDPLVASLFGGERLGGYDLPFPAADRKLLAAEYYELADCILHDKVPEVSGAVGRKAVALCYAAFESSTLNRAVTLDEVEAEEVGTYEAAINAHWGI